MADDEGENTEVLDPTALLKRVEKQTKTNKMLLTIGMAVSGVIFCIVATGLTVMFFKVSSLTESVSQEDDSAVDDQLATLDQQLMLLADFRKSELKKISQYTKQLEKIGRDCSLEKAAPYRDFLASREKDTQALLAAMQSGHSALAGMNKGSKKWLAAHKKALEELRASSKQRQRELDKLMSSDG